MEFESDNSETLANCGECKIESDPLGSLHFVSKIKEEPLEDYVETLIIEVVADEKNTSSSSELNITTELPYIKKELLDIKPEYLTIEDNTQSQVFLNKYEVGSEFEVVNHTGEEAIYNNKIKQCKQRIVCLICKNSYSSKFSLTRHQAQRHHVKKHTQQPFLCKICDKRFTWVRNLRRHLEKVHVEERFETRSETYQCYHCDKVYRKRQHLISHIKVHREKRRYQCTVCPASFDLQQTLMWHQVIHSEHKYECPMCKGSFENRQRLFKHRAQLHSRRKYFCAQFPTSFGTNFFKPAQTRHSGEIPVRQSKTERLFLCEVCGMSFSSANLFQLHKTLHEKRFQCEVCGKRYSRQGSLDHHSLSHSENARYQCETCGKRFVRKEVFERHNKNHARDPGCFLCDTCGKSFLTKEDIRSHMLYHRRKKFQCPICGLCYSTADFYNDHMKCHKSRPFRCASCPLEFTQEKHLKIHMKTHDDKGGVYFLKDSQEEKLHSVTFDNNKSSPLRCRFCSKNFPVKSLLLKHEKSHSQIKELQCPICSKTLKTNLERHMKSHSEEKPFDCSVCAKAFRVRDQLYRHMARHAVDPPFTCTVCPRGFFSSHALALHRKVHAGDCRCKVCGRDFFQVSLLEVHMRQHTGEKPFQCELCKKTFRRNDVLTKHQLKNPEKQVFPCSHCPSRFCLERDLSVHLNDHVGSNCAVCGFEYSNTYKLRSHPWTHTGETSFQCTIREKMFFSKGDLNRHSALHTEKRPFKCSICSKSFTRNWHLKRHKENVHLEREVSIESQGVDEKVDGQTEEVSEDGVTVLKEAPARKKVVIKVMSTKKKAIAIPQSVEVGKFSSIVPLC